MADSRTAYRYSIRDLLIATAGVALLLLVYKLLGLYLAISLTLTLIVCGLLFIGLSAWPLHQWKIPFAKLTLLYLSVTGLFFLFSTILGMNGVRSSSPWSFSLPFCPFLSEHEEIIDIMVVLFLLNNLTLFIICYAVLIRYAIRPILSLLMLLLNGYWLAMVLLGMHSDREERLEAILGGYFIGLVILFVPIVVRWLKPLPKTWEEIYEPLPTEAESQPDKLTAAEQTTTEQTRAEQSSDSSPSPNPR